MLAFLCGGEEWILTNYVAREYVFKELCVAGIGRHSVASCSRSRFVGNSSIIVQFIVEITFRDNHLPRKCLRSSVG